MAQMMTPNGLVVGLIVEQQEAAPQPVENPEKKRSARKSKD